MNIDKDIDEDIDKDIDKDISLTKPRINYIIISATICLSIPVTSMSYSTMIFIGATI